jgi:hypothetical protein
MIANLNGKDTCPMINLQRPHCLIFFVTFTYRSPVAWQVSTPRVLTLCISPQMLLQKIISL